MRCLAGALGLLLRRGMGFYLRVLIIGFLPRNTVAVTIVYIFVVLRNVHTFTILCKPPPKSLSRTYRGGFRKVCVVLFYDFVFTNFFILIIFFRSGMDFYCVKLIFSLQWYSLKRNIFA
jgi:hypothetical protein